jgi:hypothetical protein
MQEEELSPRLLIFTEEQILWTCRTFRACEGHPAKHVEHQSSKIGHPPRLLDHGSNLAKSNAYDMWFRTVQDYTDRGLTNSKDTMPALGGLASILHRYIDATYVAGIWSDDLARGLAWTVRRARSLEQQKPWCARHETYIAPSWSWAAISGVASFEAVRATKEEVRNQARKYGPAIIHTFNLELATLDPFGRIASAELYITAPVFHGVMGHDHDRGTNEVHNRHGIDLREDNKDYFGRLYVDVSTERDTMTYVDCIFLFSQWDDTHTTTYDDGRKKWQLLDTQETRGLGLALLPVDGRAMTYKRVGSLQHLSLNPFKSQKEATIIVI